MINYQFFDVFEITNANDSLTLILFFSKNWNKMFSNFKIRKTQNDHTTLEKLWELWVGGW
jgi:hypothetical protein